MSESRSLQHEVPPVDGGVLVAVSGGRDSTSLALQLARNPDCSPLHLAWLRHGFRPPDPTEEAIVRGVAAHVGRPLHVLSDSPDGDWCSQRAIPENWARQRRYARLAALARDLGVRVIATAHHRFDQRETRILHMLRRGGLRGLAGMQVLRKLDDLWLWRPMLRSPAPSNTSAVDNVSVFEDPSNQDLRSRRNLVRHRVIPELERTADPFWAHLDLLGERADRAWRRLDHHLTRWIRTYAQPTCLRSAYLLPLDPILRMGPALRHHLIELALRQAGTSRWHLSRSRSDEVNRWLDQDVKGTQTIGGAGLERSGPWLAVRGASAVDPAPGNGASITWTWRQVGNPGAPHRDRLDPPRTAHGAWIDRRRSGDRVRVGRRGTRKLKALFLEAGVARLERDHWPVVRDDQGIVWVPQVAARDDAESSRRSIQIVGLPDLEARRGCVDARRTLESR